MFAKVWGKSYNTQADLEARIAELEAVNAQYGESDGRVTEINALRDALPAEAPAAEADVWEVVQDEYEMPCDHPACATMHRHLHNYRYDTPQWETVENLRTGEARQVKVSTYHMKTVRQWVITHNGERANHHALSDAWDTKREAVAMLKRYGH